MMEDMNVYYVVTYTNTDPMASFVVAYAHNLYSTLVYTALGLSLGRNAALRKTDNARYWDEVDQVIVKPLDDGAHWVPTPSKLILVGDDVVDLELSDFVQDQLYEYYPGLNESSLGTIVTDPIFVQAKGAAELIFRHLSDRMRSGKRSYLWRKWWSYDWCKDKGLSL